MSTDSVTREPEGTPAGGRFAASQRPEPVGVDLSGDLQDIARRLDLAEANDLINGVYDQLTDSPLLDELRFDPDTGEESDTYPVDAHQDAVRALRRYRDAMRHAVAGTQDPNRVLRAPMNLQDAIAACDADGVLTGVVEVDLEAIVSAGVAGQNWDDSDDLSDLLAGKLVTGVQPCGTGFEVVGMGAGGKLHVRVTTEVRNAMYQDIGPGVFEQVKAGAARACEACQGVYDTADAHDCGGQV